mgnify:CR=1 FL=1
MSKKPEVRGSIPEIIRNDHNLYEGDLNHYFRAVFKHAQNLFNPYHNFRHIFHVTWLCYQACIFYREAMSPREMRNLLIASIFHDFDHTGKPGPDSVNIERAITGLRKHLASEDKDEFPNIEAIIKATEYPYVVPSGKLDLLCQIIRDADLSQAFSPVWIQQVVFGLAGEWMKPPYEVLKAQGAFLKNLNFSTAWAREMFPESAINKKIAEANELLALLDEQSVGVA